MLRGIPSSAVCIGFLAFGAATAPAQSVSERNGHIFFTDQNGVEKPITNGNLDSEPHLSFDKRQIVFVRQTPGQTVENGSGNVDNTELWIASVDGRKQPKRVLTGGGIINGKEWPNQKLVIADFSNRQFSPDATRIYFKVYAWVTAFEIMMLDVPTGNVTPLFPGGDVEVIGTGKYRGFLIGTTDPLTKNHGRIIVYWLLNPNGKAVKRICDLIRFKRKYDIR